MIPSFCQDDTHLGTAQALYFQQCFAGWATLLLRSSFIPDPILGLLLLVGKIIALRRLLMRHCVLYVSAVWFVSFDLCP